MQALITTNGWMSDTHWRRCLTFDPAAAAAAAAAAIADGVGLYRVVGLEQ